MSGCSVYPPSTSRGGAVGGPLSSGAKVLGESAARFGSCACSHCDGGVVTVRDHVATTLGSGEAEIPSPTGSRADLRGAPATVPVRGRRRPGLIALGALLASVGALLVVWMVGAAGQRQEVLVVRQELAYGDTVTPESLGIARVSVDPGVEVVPASRRTIVLGLVATTRLTPGSLLTERAVAPVSGPEGGQVLVPLALPLERMPAGGLRPGDRLLAVTTQPEQSASASFPAVVARVGEMDVNGVSVIDVTTAAANGPGLAVAAAEGRIAVLVQPSAG
jgi:hypothetical protein